MQRNTEYNKYTYIYNIRTYNILLQLLTTSRSTTKPTSNRRTATVGNWRYILPLQTLTGSPSDGNRRKLARNNPYKNVIKLYNITFF